MINKKCLHSHPGLEQDDKSDRHHQLFIKHSLPTGSIFLEHPPIRLLNNRYHVNEVTCLSRGTSGCTGDYLLTKL